MDQRPKLVFVAAKEPGFFYFFQGLVRRIDFFRQQKVFDFLDLPVFESVADGKQHSGENRQAQQQLDEIFSMADFPALKGEANVFVIQNHLCNLFLFFGRAQNGSRNFYSIRFSGSFQYGRDLDFQGRIVGELAMEAVLDRFNLGMPPKIFFSSISARACRRNRCIS